MHERWSLSPHEVDPWSWFAGPAIPRVFAAVVVVGGVLSILADITTAGQSLLRLMAVFLMVATLIVVDQLSRPHRSRVALWHIGLAMIPAWLGLWVSAIALSGANARIEMWWAPLGLGLVLASLAPYTSAARLGVICAASLVVTGIVTAAYFIREDSVWPPLTVIVIGMVPIMLGTVAGLAVSIVIVRRILAWAQEPTTDVSDDDSRPPQSRHDELELVLDRVKPFLSGIADSGVVSDQDRVIAAQYARRLRDDLVRRANSSWLETIAKDRALTVLDTHRRADAMTGPQRNALRSFLLAVLESPVVDRSSVLVELRPDPDGATAVALTIDLDLPEGRRAVLLAPYYLTLRTTVDDLTWHNGSDLKVKFQLPATLRGRPS